MVPVSLWYLGCPEHQDKHHSGYMVALQTNQDRKAEIKLASTVRNQLWNDVRACRGKVSPEQLISDLRL